MKKAQFTQVAEIHRQLHTEERHRFTTQIDRIHQTATE
jgi:hypothetical protein